MFNNSINWRKNNQTNATSRFWTDFFIFKIQVNHFFESQFYFTHKSIFLLSSREFSLSTLFIFDTLWGLVLYNAEHTLFTIDGDLFCQIYLKHLKHFVYSIINSYLWRFIVLNNNCVLAWSYAEGFKWQSLGAQLTQVNLIFSQN